MAMDLGPVKIGPSSAGYQHSLFNSAGVCVVGLQLHFRPTARPCPRIAGFDRVQRPPHSSSGQTQRVSPPHFAFVIQY